MRRGESDAEVDAPFREFRDAVKEAQVLGAVKLRRRIRADLLSAWRRRKAASRA
jgi:hypothetical protein